MDYKVVVTTDAEEDLERFVKYLIFEKKSLQAADRKSTRLNSSHRSLSRMPSSA